MQQAYGQTYVEQFLHQIVELLCATENNGHSAQVYIYFLIMCLYYIYIYTGVAYVKLSDNAWELLIIKMSN